MTNPRENPIKLVPIVLEAFFVVLGVVLALGANEVREFYNRKEHGEVALTSITREIEENRSAVAAALDYHLYLSDTLRTIQRSNESSVLEHGYPDARVFSKGFISPATVLNTAWEAANATDALGVMDYEDVLLLSRIYESQRVYAYQSQVSGDLIYAKLFSEGYIGMLENYQNLSTMIGSFWYQECRLLMSYDDLIAELDSTLTTAALPDMCRVVSMD